MYSEDRLWSIFRFQISPYQFCSITHQYCFNESFDSESGVFVKCPAILLWELVLIIMMSSEESPGPVTCVLFGSFTGRCTTGSWMQQASCGG